MEPLQTANTLLDSKIYGIQKEQAAKHFLLIDRSQK
jgi:hypothetical protein